MDINEIQDILNCINHIVTDRIYNNDLVTRFERNIDNVAEYAEDFIMLLNLSKLEHEDITTELLASIPEDNNYIPIILLPKILEAWVGNISVDDIAIWYDLNWR